MKFPGSLCVRTDRRPRKHERKRRGRDCPADAGQRLAKGRMEEGHENSQLSQANVMCDASYATFSAMRHATSATGRARLPIATASALAAFPCNARDSTPCRIAAMRNMLKIR